MCNFKSAIRGCQSRSLPGQTHCGGLRDARCSGRAGFTLVEILVVMGIIAMLSTLAVGGYMSYRRSALLDLGAENLISQINAMKAKATYGSNGAAKYDEIKGKLSAGDSGGAGGAPVTADPQCYGVKFEKSFTGDTFSVTSFKVKFDNKKKWDVNKKDWLYTACGNPVDADLLPLELDASLKILKISGKDGSGADVSISSPFVLRFLPPNGKLESVDYTDLKTLTLSIGYGSDDTNYKREIILNLSSGKFCIEDVANATKKCSKK